jgi:hypothetical protein
MSMNLFAYLEMAPSLDEMRGTLNDLGLVYRHTLPADDRWDYPMHVFGRADLRVVYHAGDPLRGEAMVDSSAGHDSQQSRIAIHMILTVLVRHYGGAIHDPSEMHRGAVL